MRLNKPLLALVRTEAAGRKGTYIKILLGKIIVNILNTELRTWCGPA
jgi:hypothetical protein